MSDQPTNQTEPQLKEFVVFLDDKKIGTVKVPPNAPKFVFIRSAQMCVFAARKYPCGEIAKSKVTETEIYLTTRDVDFSNDTTSNPPEVFVPEWQRKITPPKPTRFFSNPKKYLYERKFRKLIAGVESLLENTSEGSGQGTQFLNTFVQRELVKGATGALKSALEQYEIANYTN